MFRKVYFTELSGADSDFWKSAFEFLKIISCMLTLHIRLYESGCANVIGMTASLLSEA